MVCHCQWYWKQLRKWLSWCAELQNWAVSNEAKSHDISIQWLTKCPFWEKKRKKKKTRWEFGTVLLKKDLIPGSRKEFDETIKALLKHSKSLICTQENLHPFWSLSPSQGFASRFQNTWICQYSAPISPPTRRSFIFHRIFDSSPWFMLAFVPLWLLFLQPAQHPPYIHSTLWRSLCQQNRSYQLAVE